MASFFRSSSIFTPKDYQRAAAAAVYVGQRMEGIRSQLVVLPTGTGKTILFGFMAGANSQRGKRTLILAHRDTLIGQAVDKLNLLGLQPAIEKAEQKALYSLRMGKKIVVGSVQTLRGHRLASWPRDAFDDIFIDEGHRGTGSSYRAIVDHFDSAHVVGFTATDRSKKGKLKKVYQRLAYQMTLVDAIAQNHLVPVYGKRADVRINLKGLTVRGGDYDVHELDERISMEIEPLALATRQEIGSRVTIAFTPDIKSARAFAAALNRIGVSAGATWGTDPDQKTTLAAFHEGRIQVLCNCSLLTEGYDWPPISAVVIACPTKSSTKLMQAVGRGTRLHPQSGKVDCLAIDFLWVADDDTVQTFVDLFADDADDDRDVSRAKQMMASNAAMDPRAAIDRARADREQDEADKAETIRLAKESADRKQKANEYKINIADRPITYKSITTDPFGVGRIMGFKQPGSTPGVVGMPVTNDTAQKLFDLGYRSVAGLSETDALKQIAECEHAAACGMASVKQKMLLLKFGYHQSKLIDLTKRQATKMIVECKARVALKRTGENH